MPAVRRILSLWAVLGVPAAAALVLAAACSQTGTLAVPPEAGAADATQGGPEAGDDGGADTSAPVDSGTPPVMADACGPAPWVELGILVVALDLSNPDGSALPGAQFSSPLCPGVVKVSDDAGMLTGEVSEGVPFVARLTKSGYISELAPEEVFDADSTGNKVEMLPTILGNFVPGYEADASTIVVAAVKTQDDAGACSALDGVSLSVDGHPEVHVTYFSSSSIPAPLPDASATSTRGLAAITGAIPDGGFVTLTGTKAGCHVVFVRGPITGRVPLENGYVSVMPAYVTP